jgi:hypothetical protein
MFTEHLQGLDAVGGFQHFVLIVLEVATDGLAGDETLVDDEDGIGESLVQHGSVLLESPS